MTDTKQVAQIATNKEFVPKHNRIISEQNYLSCDLSVRRSGLTVFVSSGNQRTPVLAEGDDNFVPKHVQPLNVNKVLRSPPTSPQVSDVTTV